MNAGSLFTPKKNIYTVKYGTREGLGSCRGPTPEAHGSHAAAYIPSPPLLPESILRLSGGPCGPSSAPQPSLRAHAAVRQDEMAVRTAAEPYLPNPSVGQQNLATGPSGPQARSPYWDSAPACIPRGAGRTPGRGGGRSRSTPAECGGACGFALALELLRGGLWVLAGAASHRPRISGHSRLFSDVPRTCRSLAASCPRPAPSAGPPGLAAGRRVPAPSFLQEE